MSQYIYFDTDIYIEVGRTIYTYLYKKNGTCVDFCDRFVGEKSGVEICKGREKQYFLAFVSLFPSACTLLLFCHEKLVAW